MLKNARLTPKFKVWYAISVGVLLVASIFLLIFGGFNKGLEFSGGNAVTVNTGSYIALGKENRIEVSDISRAFFKSNGFKVESEQFSPTEGLILYKFAHKINGKKVTPADFQAKIDAAGAELEAGLKSKITSVNADFEVTSYNFGKSVSKTVYWQTPLAFLTFCAVVFVYLLFRVKIPAAAGTVIAAIHAVLIMLALTAIFRYQVNTAVISAALTACVYTVFLSVLVFARVRSLKKTEGGFGTPEQTADAAIKYAFKQSLISTAVFLALLIAFIIFGTVGIKKFALPIVAAVISAFYSAVLIAPPLWTHFENISIRIKSSKRYLARYAAKKAAAKKVEESA